MQGEAAVAVQLRGEAPAVAVVGSPRSHSGPPGPQCLEMGARKERMIEREIV